MVEHSYVFRDIAMVFAAALACGFLAWRLRQPILLSYVLAGLLMSPLTPGLLTQIGEFSFILAQVSMKAARRWPHR